LQAEPKLMEQTADELVADVEALRDELTSEATLATAEPAQRRLRIAADRVVNQLQQGRGQRRLLARHCLATAALATQPTRICVATAAQLPQPATDRAARDTGHLRYRQDPTAACRLGLARRKQTPAPFIQERSQHFKPRRYASSIYHPHKI
jgi:hypothetical protein